MLAMEKIDGNSEIAHVELLGDMICVGHLLRSSVTSLNYFQTYFTSYVWNMLPSNISTKLSKKLANVDNISNIFRFRESKSLNHFYIVSIP